MKINRKQILASLKKQKLFAKEVIENSDHVPGNLMDSINEIEKAKEHLVKLVKNKYSKVGKAMGDERIKILSLSDLHIPFDNYEVILDALTKHGDADILVLNGDILEQYAVSRWGKSKSILLEWEYKIAMKWMEVFTEMFEEVHLVRGNHDARLRKYLADMVDPMLNFLMHDDLLSRMAQGYDFNEDNEFVKMHDFDNVYYKGGQLGWYTKIGKCVFAHPEGASGVPMKTVVSAATVLSASEDFEALIIGHTHKMGSVIWRDKLLIEQGCCCTPMDYQSDGKLKYLPQSFGYVVVYMDEHGNVDFDETKTVYRGTGFPTKADLQ